jgi:serine protease AprX
MPVLAASGLLAPAFGNSAAAAGIGLNLDINLPIQPYLQYGAKVNPSHSVKVIVRKSTPLVDSQLLAAALGSTVLEEFPLIQSFELSLPVGQLTSLIRLPGVQFVSYDGPVRGTAVDVSNLQTTFPASADVAAAWNVAAPATGQGVTVAVIDTGVNAAHPDLAGHVTAVSVNPKATSAADGEGHGTHVAGIIAGRDPQGHYIGVAPDAHVISVKVSDDTGNSNESDLIRGLSWVYTNRAAYGIRAVNVSAHALTSSSYLTSPVDAAVEALWQAGVVVVAAAGNEGAAHAAVWHAPGNDPFAVTVGALDDNQTAALGDDSLATFSSRGKTIEFINKPDVVAPGRKIVAPLASQSAVLARLFPNRIAADGQHIRLSGTSMAAPVVTGTVALLLQRYPSLTPDQVKWVLLNSTRTYSGQPDGAGAIDALHALQLAARGSVGRANQGYVPSTGGLLAPVIGLLGALVPAVSLDASSWDASSWNASSWDASSWDASSWDASSWDASSWDASSWDASRND